MLPARHNREAFTRLMVKATKQKRERGTIDSDTGAVRFICTKRPPRPATFVPVAIYPSKREYRIRLGRTAHEQAFAAGAMMGLAEAPAPKVCDAGDVMKDALKRLK